MATNEQALQEGQVDYVALRQQALSAEKNLANQPVLSGGEIDYRAIRAAAVQEDPAPTKIGENKWSVETIVNDYLSPAAEDLGRHHSRGKFGVARGYALAEALAGNRNVKEVLAEYKEREKMEGLDKTDLTPFGSILGPVAEVMAPMQDAISKSIAGSAAGGGVGLMVGGPAGGVAGAGWGAGAGLYVPLSVNAAGTVYGDLIDQGVPDAVAQQVATFAGPVLGGLGATSWNLMGKAGQKAFVDYIKGEGQTTLKDFAKSYIGHVATQGALGGADRLTKQVAGTIAKAVGNNKAPTPEEFVKGFLDLWNGIGSGAVQGAVLVPALQGTGALSGRVIKALFKMKSNPTPANTAEAVDAILNPNEPEPLEARITRDYQEATKIALPEKQKAERRNEKKAELKADMKVQAKRISNAEQQLEALTKESEQTEQDFDLYIEQQEKLAAIEKSKQKSGDADKIADLEQQREWAARDLKAAQKDLQDATKKAQINSAAKRVRKLEGSITKLDNEIRDLNAPYEAAKIHNRRRIDLEKQKAATMAELRRRIILAREDKVAAAETHRDLKAEYVEIESKDRKVAKERLAAAIVDSQPRDGESKVRGANIQKVLNLFKQFVTDGEARQKAEDDFYKAIASGEPTEDQRIAFEVAKQIPAEIRKASADDINRVARAIESITKEGEKNKAVIEAERREQSERLIGEVNAGVDGDRDGAARPVDTSSEHADPRSSRGAVSRAGDFFRQYGSPFFTWRGKLRIALQDMKDVKKREEIVKQLSWAEPMKAQLRAKRFWADRYFDLLKEKTGLSTTGVLKELAMGAATRKTIRYTDIKGSQVSVTMNLPQLAHTLLMMNDPTLRKGLEEGNGYTLEGVGSTKDAIESELPQVWKGVAEATREFFSDREFGAYFGEGYERHTGLPLPINKTYSGPAHRVGHDKETNAAQWEVELNSYRPKATTVNEPGSSIERVDSALGLRSKNIFSNVMGHIENVTNYVEKHEHSQTVGAVLADPGVQKRLDVKFPGLRQQIEAHHNDILYGVTERVIAFQELINHTASGIAIDALGVNPSQWFKQAAGVVNGALEIPLAPYVAGLTHYQLNEKAAKANLMSSPTIAARYSGFESVASGVAGDSGQLGLYTRGMREVSLIPMKEGDKLASLRVAHAMYQWKKNTGHSHAEALAAAEEIVETTQASGRTDELGIANRHPILRMFSVMTQPTYRMWEHETNAWRDAINHGGADPWKKAIKTTVVLGLSNAAFKLAGAAYTQMWVWAGVGTQEDADNAYWRAVRGLFLREDMPVFGEVGDSALLDLQKDMGVPTTERKYFRGLLPTTVGDTLDKTVMFHRKIEKAQEDGTITGEELAAIIHSFAGSAYNRLGTQLPLSHPTGLIKKAHAEDDETIFEVPAAEDGEDE